MVTSCDLFEENLITGCKDGKVAHWKKEFNGKEFTFSLLKRYKGHEQSVVNVEIGKKTGTFFVSADISGFLKLWNITKGTCRTVKAQNKDQNFARISPNEKYIISGG